MGPAKARLQAATERFWAIPAVVIALAMGCGMAMPAVDRSVTLPDWLAISGQEDTARAVLTAIVALGVSVAGVSFSVIVVALVLASQQLSPRVLRSFQRQRLNQAVLALLLGSATYALFVLGFVSEEEDQPVPELSVTLAMALAAASLGLFVIFLHHAIRSLNASAVIRRIAAEGHEAIASPYPAHAGREPDDPADAEAEVEALAGGSAISIEAPRAGYIASVDGARIVTWAAQQDALVEQRRGVGDFVVTGGILAVVHSHHDLDPEPVRGAFLLNEERLVDGDIAFPIRQLADIALKGLSPGVNDPTTAENAMNSITDTLVRFANRPPVSALRVDDRGIPRLRAVAPTLDGLVRLGFDQVRRDCAGRPSFATRILELLADLHESAPSARHSCEIDRQAALIADHAASITDQQADQRLVIETYERLHADRDTARAPANVEA